MYTEENVNTPTQNATSRIRYEIEDAFIRIGIPSNLKGWDYTVSAITMVVVDRNVIHSITAGMYRALAEIYNTSHTCVERGICHLIETAYERGNQSELEKCVGYANPKTGKLANSEFISNFAKHIWYKIYGYN